MNADDPMYIYTYCPDGSLHIGKVMPEYWDEEQKRWCILEKCLKCDGQIGGRSLPWSKCECSKDQIHDVEESTIVDERGALAICRRCKNCKAQETIPVGLNKKFSI